MDCCIFAGQGAQVPGMGKDFAEADAEAMALFDKANAVLGFDLKKICFEGPAEELTKSNVCQPAIFVTSYAAYRALQNKRPTPFAWRPTTYVLPRATTERQTHGPRGAMTWPTSSADST